MRIFKIVSRSLRLVTLGQRGMDKNQLDVDMFLLFIIVARICMV